MGERDLATFGPPGRFYECPTWRGGRWWLSDMRDARVYSFSEEGEGRVDSSARFGVQRTTGRT